MDAPTNLRYDDFNIFRRPDERWRRAVDLARSALPPSAHDDSATEAALDYLRSSANGGDGKERLSERSWPEIAAAQHLYDQNGPSRWEVEARLLAGQTDEQIAAYCGISPGAVAWYERLFCQVRDRLDARDWIATKVLGCASGTGFGRDEIGRLWATFGYYGGPTPLDLLIAVMLDRPLPPQFCAGVGTDARVYQARLRLKVKLCVSVMMIRSAADVQAVRQLYRAQQRLERAALGTATGRDRNLEAMLATLAAAYRAPKAEGGTARVPRLPSARNCRLKQTGEGRMPSPDSVVRDLVEMMAGAPAGRK